MRKLHSFYLDPALTDGLKRIKQRDGIPEAEQVRRALERWLRSKGLKMGAFPKANLT